MVLDVLGQIGGVSGHISHVDPGEVSWNHADACKHEGSESAWADCPHIVQERVVQWRKSKKEHDLESGLSHGFFHGKSLGVSLDHSIDAIAYEEPNEQEDDACGYEACRYDPDPSHPQSEQCPCSNAEDGFRKKKERAYEKDANEDQWSPWAKGLHKRLYISNVGFKQINVCQRDQAHDDQYSKDSQDQVLP